MNRIIICLLASVLAIPAYSQWESMQGPEGGYMGDMYQNASYYFVNTSHGLYRSSNGTNWEQLHIALPEQYSIGPIAVTDSLLYVSLKGYYHQTDSSLLLRSADQGNTWLQLNPPELYYARNLKATDQTVVFGGPDSLWLSHDYGDTWELSLMTPAAEYIYDIQGSEESFIITAIGGKKFRFYPDTDTWSASGLPDSLYFERIFEFDSIWFAFTVEQGRMYRSADDGHTWSLISTKNWEDGYPRMSKTANAFYISAFDDLYVSVDKGVTWNITPLQDFECNALYPADTGLFITTRTGLFRMAETDYALQTSHAGIVATRVGSLHTNNDYVWFTAAGHSVSRYNSAANDFEYDLYGGSGIEDIVTLDGRVFALQDGRNVIRSNDNGATWKDASPPYLYTAFYELFADYHTLYLGGTYYSNYFIEPLRSFDYGSTWHPFEINNGQYASSPYLIARQGNVLYAADDQFIFKSHTDGNSWESINTDVAGNGSIYKMVGCENFLLLIVRSSNWDYETFISSDEGSTWSEITFDPAVNPPYDGFTELLCIADHIVATSNRSQSKIYVSSDLGVTWKIFNEGLYPAVITGLASDEEFIYAGTSGQGVWRIKITDILTFNTQEDSRADVLHVFPNPTSGSISFQSHAQSEEKALILLTDLTGKQVFSTQQNIIPGINSIEITSLDGGLYILSVETKGGIVTGKVMLL